MFYTVQPDKAVDIISLSQHCSHTQPRVLSPVFHGGVSTGPHCEYPEVLGRICLLRRSSAWFSRDQELGQLFFAVHQSSTTVGFEPMTSRIMGVRVANCAIGMRTPPEAKKR